MGNSLYVNQTSEYLLVTILYTLTLIIMASNITQLKWLKEIGAQEKIEISHLEELHDCLKI